MRKALAAICLIVLPALPAHAEAPRWNVDNAKSAIEFTAIQNNAPIKGSFTQWSANIAFDPEQLAQSSATITIHTGSVTTSYDEVAETLKTPDWFNTAAFPDAVFKATTFRSLGGNKYEAEGTLTLRDISQPVTLAFTLDEFSATNASITGTARLKRTAFGIGQGEWKDTGAIKDEVQVNVRVAATRINP